MNDRITIQTAGPVRGTIRPPGSKSITNRALVCAALANGQSRLSGALDSEDTQVMIESLGQLGLRVDHQKQKDTIVVDGCGGKLPKDHADLFVANSGTTMRFLTAMVSVGAGQFRLDGIERMRQRPLGDLISAVNQLGGHVSCEQDNDCPPVLIDAKGLSGGRAVIRGNISSQFLSGLLMAAPYAKSRVEILVDAALVSQPYVRMTLEVMQCLRRGCIQPRITALRHRGTVCLSEPFVRDRARRVRGELLLGGRGHFGRTGQRARSQQGLLTGRCTIL